MTHVVHGILVYILLIQLFVMYTKVHLNFKLQRAGLNAGLTGLKYLFRK